MTEQTEQSNLFQELTWPEAAKLAQSLHDGIRWSIRRIRMLKGNFYAGSEIQLYEGLVDEMSAAYWEAMQQFYTGPSPTQEFMESIIHQDCITQPGECLNPDHCIQAICLKAERKAHEKATARDESL